MQSPSMRLLSLVSLLVACAATCPVRAESKWLFVPVAASPNADLEKVVRAFEVAAGDGALRNATAAQQFEHQRSREPSELPPAEVARIETAAQEAVTQLGSCVRCSAARLAPGRAALERVEATLSGERGDGYRRSPARVQTLWDACGLSAMLLARARQPEEAAAQMEHCVRAYPGFVPEGNPEIQSLFDAASARVAHGVLRVEGGHGCMVRADGMELGPAPLERALPTGQYRVQVECVSNAPGRVHLVRVSEEGSRFLADPLDASVRTRPSLRLQRTESADEDSRVLEQLLAATEVILLIPEDSSSTRVRVHGRDIAVLAVGEDVRPVVSLLDAPPPEKPSAAPLATEPSEPTDRVAAEATSEVSRRSTLEYVAGLSLVAVGTGALTVGWVLYGDRYSIRSRIYGSDVPFDTRDRFDGRGTALLGVSAFGALAFAAAEPFLVSDDGIPSAAWVLAAGGLALAGAGIGFAFADHCEPQLTSRQVPGAACGFFNDATFGPLLALHGAPLLALPLMYGLRQLIGGESTVVLGFEATGGRIAIGGTF